MLSLELVLKYGILSLHEYLRNLKKKDFTRKIHTLLIEIMNNEDDYVDLPTILQRMSV